MSFANVPPKNISPELSRYETESFYDEMYREDGTPHPWTLALHRRLAGLDAVELKRRQRAAERALFDMGITFNVYHHEEATEKIFPIDLIPRVVRGAEWNEIEQGLKQRIRALNLFIDDVYHDRKIVKEGIIPEEVILSSDGYLEACAGLNPSQGIWCHISGTDLVRDRSGTPMVLEDNLRSPSGVSYALANRDQMKRTFPGLFIESQVRPISDYPSLLLDMLTEVAPPTPDRPQVAILTPGRYNSAYFEHSFLAREMGCPLIEGCDLVCQDGFVWMKTTCGLRRVDVVYRRINDDFLDPLVFRSDSVLGAKGLMDVYRSGNVTIVNAPGAGVADDKVVYAYVPDIIRFYLSEEPILPNVETFLCWRKADLQHVLANLDTMVVKPANGAGGYDMLIGPHATVAEREAFAERIKQNPRNYIGQPTLALSRSPVLVGDSLEGRHVDLRPYILHGKEVRVMPGGLTRVALRKGSLVVNSSQGGGSKDTWVVDVEVPPC